jgi:alkanesulfonate monooxygenase SsuD/methylene tetrahydromethanopterin reductase-like flavin-dependent oxidoreductase (luciferase family)
MAYARSELSFIFTNPAVQQHRYTFASTVTTLDHITSGRLRWNLYQRNSPSSPAAKPWVGKGPDHDEVLGGLRNLDSIPSFKVDREAVL